MKWAILYSELKVKDPTRHLHLHRRGPQFFTVQYSTVQFDSIQYSTLKVQGPQHLHRRGSQGTVQYSTFQYSKVQFSAITVKDPTAIYTYTDEVHKIHYSTVQYGTVRYTSRTRPSTP